MLATVTDNGRWDRRHQKKGRLCVKIESRKNEENEGERDRERA